ncbi:unnamed protein product [Anisakis simplex]|uniref:Uncharacterized protein n=1 Tax=Anisakis simplex TaxID=6269 RepID=A0A0M3JVF5_ANISI|nr:unnamed protein product [Anisakis simplex]
MWLNTLVVRKLIQVVRFVTFCLKRILCCSKRRKDSESLPFTVNKHEPSRDYDSSQSQNQWNSWSNKPFVNVVEEKIDEYRRKQAELLALASQQENACDEPDFFSDMQPNVKRAKKVFILCSREILSFYSIPLFVFL